MDHLVSVFEDLSNGVSHAILFDVQGKVEEGVLTTLSLLQQRRKAAW
jgi:hypothetical protein